MDKLLIIIQVIKATMETSNFDNTDRELKS